MPDPAATARVTATAACRSARSQRPASACSPAHAARDAARVSVATARPPTNICRAGTEHSHGHTHTRHSAPPHAGSGGALAPRFGVLPSMREQAARQRRAMCGRPVAVAGRRAGEARLDGPEHDSVLGPSRRLTPSVKDPGRVLYHHGTNDRQNDTQNDIQNYIQNFIHECHNPNVDKRLYTVSQPRATDPLKQTEFRLVLDRAQATPPYTYTSLAGTRARKLLTSSEQVV